MIARQGHHVLDQERPLVEFSPKSLQEVEAGASIIGLYPATNEETLKKFAVWKVANNR